MTYLGAHTFGFIWDASAQAATERLIEAGFHHIEYLATAPHLDAWRTDRATLAALRRTVEAGGGSVVTVDMPSSESNLASPNPEVVDFAVSAHLKLLDLASELGAPWFTVNSGRRHGLLPPPDGRLLHVYRGALERLVRAAEPRGVRVMLENIPGMLLAESPAAKAFLDANDYGMVDVLFDVTNAAAAGEAPADGIRLLGDRIKLVHLSDAPAGQWRHDPIGTGAIDFAAIRAALREIGYAGGVMIEAISADTLADLIASRDRLHGMGWRFGAG
ncbi:MAG: sugar phosphate isomerase/epimerase [Proteobacteria bacterium]|nr:sugar phosphate isomerase/epimerase [Pseudomonadota bacterium]